MRRFIGFWFGFGNEAPGEMSDDVYYDLEKKEEPSVWMHIPFVPSGLGGIVGDVDPMLKQWAIVSHSSGTQMRQVRESL